MSTTKSNGVATSGVAEVTKTNKNGAVKKAETPMAEVLKSKRNKVHELEGFCENSLNKIGIFKTLEDYGKCIGNLRNIIKESSGDIKVIIYAGHDEQLRVSKPDVIEEVLILLNEKNNAFMDQLIDEIVD